MGDFIKTPLKNKKLLESLKFPASPFLKKIGFGTGVTVYELQRSPISNKVRSPWALKKLTKRNRKDNELDLRLCDEAEILRKLDHPNIVGFRAFLKGDDGRNILAMEECNNCLGDMIEERSNQNLPPYEPKTIDKVTRDLASALNYLHNTALILHCDVKSYNVLVKGDFTICKLCDFGVCLPLKKTGELDTDKVDVSTEYIGTMAWSSPEILSLPQVITSKADIYAYGLIIWEMIALLPPVQDDDDDDDLNESSDSFQVTNKRMRPPLPDVDLSEDYDFLLELHYCCTHEEYKRRPSAADLIEIFSEMDKQIL